jgi:hypothetical protein
MRKLISVYNRAFKSLNSSGPDDPTTTVYMVDEDTPFPQKLMDADAVRFLASEYGGIVWAPDTVRQSIETAAGAMKASVLIAVLNSCRSATLAGLEADLK